APHAESLPRPRSPSTPLRGVLRSHARSAPAGDRAPSRPRGRAARRAVPLPVHTCTPPRRVPSSCCRPSSWFSSSGLDTPIGTTGGRLRKGRCPESPHVGGLYFGGGRRDQDSNLEPTG